MQIEILQSTVSDNWFYLVHDGDHAALIDPIDATVGIAAVKAAGAQLQWVVNTHFHPDHTGGNAEVLAAFEDVKLCSGPDANMIAGVDHVVRDGDELHIGSITCQILETPGHTAGHISLHVGEHLFSGDTIFVGGAGNCRFGGDPGVLFRTYRDVLSPLADRTVFYPGHDYSRRNLEFALHIEPDNTAAEEFLAQGTATEALTLTTLGDERRYNPFFRADDPALQRSLQERHGELWREQRELSHDDAEATFRATRALRNDW